MESTSPRYQLNQTDLKKTGTGLLIALCGAGVTYLTDLIPNVNWGEFTPLVVAFWSVAINLLRKYFSNYKEAFPTPPPDYIEKAIDQSEAKEKQAVEYPFVETEGKGKAINPTKPRFA